MKDYDKPVKYTDLTNIKVGDKVQIKSKAWYDKYKGKTGSINITYSFTDIMSDLCGRIATVEYVGNGGYDNRYMIRLKGIPFNWSEQMLKKVQEKIFELE